MKKTYDVAIVGGGPVGLATSILLSMHNIDHLLFERHPSTSIHPKACGLNQRTIEVFRQMGIEKDFLELRAPSEISGRTAWYTSLGPEGKEIVSRDAWGGGQYTEKYAKASPCPYVVAPQIRFEPILRHKASELNPNCLQFGSEVVDVKELDGSTELTVRRNEHLSSVQARYCIVADGGRSFTDKLKIGWEGERDLVAMIAVHFRAPISCHHPDPRNFITWFVNPALGGSIGTGYIYHLGPYPTRPETEEWLFACALNPEDPRKFDRKYVLQRLRNTLQISELPIEVLSFSHWHINAVTASTYRSRPHDGRIFLVGDAAHRIPPYGGLGLNTGVQDAYNLVWKLAFALQSTCVRPLGSFNRLLDSYTTERKPIAQRVARSGLQNVRSHAAVIDKAIGILPGNTKEQNIAAVESFLNAETEQADLAKCRALHEAQEILDCEFNALGTEAGWFYPSLDLAQEGLQSRHDGQIGPDGDFDTLDYHPSTIPGHHLPHAWISARGKTISTRDLQVTGQFLLIGGTPGLWDEIVEQVPGLVQVQAITETYPCDDHSDVWLDAHGTWAKVRGVSATGAVLVRPDGIVCWRGSDASALDHHEGQAPSLWFRNLIEESLMLKH
ncbi:hypothetical protein H2200_009529 [Cladophialophora chaetospira]|uniref:FAD-binding domain-containing protein n=1 Tax=Cladophialophora chaetospira TaxID=386627 RepID=A0AA38X2T9_9EURO|nr:hypothetical protein H2200_009529 [Cladophialophora chaetospira]